jgi:large repetitive protein
VLFTDAPLITDAFAYETTVKNEVQGIGVDTYDLAADFGSAGRLRSLVVMDWLGKYPDNPLQKFLGENNTVSLLGQESGHRWLAFMEFRDRTGERSDALLGRDLAHWSFFFDSDASVMEGNKIQDLGGGSFRTAAAVQRYSLLDQYAMGLVPDTAVPPFFYVESPVNLSAERTRESAPEAGVTFNGTRREVLIQDIIAINGPRVPSSAETTKLHRQAFVYMPGAGKSADSGQVNKLDQIRRAWEGFFLQATDGRMAAVTTLR